MLEVRQPPKESMMYTHQLMLTHMQFVYVRGKLKALMVRRRLLVDIRERKYEPQKMASREMGGC